MGVPLLLRFIIALPILRLTVLVLMANAIVTEEVKLQERTATFERKLPSSSSLGRVTRDVGGISKEINDSGYHSVTSGTTTDVSNSEAASDQNHREAFAQFHDESQGSRGISDISSTTEGTDLTNITDTYYDTNDTNYNYYYYDYDTEGDTSTDVLRQISFTKTLYFCEYLYSAMHGEYTSFPDSGIMYNNRSVTVVHEEKFLNICKPLYDVFGNNCSEIDESTFCTDENVLFLKHRCKRPSPQDVHFEHLLAATLLADDDKCFHSVCSGKTRVIDKLVDEIHTRLFSPGGAHMNNSCDSFLQQYYFLNNSDEVYGTKNEYWASCYPGYTILWSLDPQKHDQISNRSYLPTNCQTSEIILMVIIGIIVVCGGVSNIAVILLLLEKRFLFEGSKLLKFSLAVSDLLICFFVLAPTMHKYLLLMYGYTEDIKLFSSYLEIKQFVFDDQTSTSMVNSGFQLFSAIVMGTCTLNSLVILFSLSCERFLAATETSKLKEIFSSARVKVFVTACWILSLTFSLILILDFNGIPSEWSSFRKIPMGVHTQSQKVALIIMMVIFGILCIATTVLSTLAVYHYWRLENQKPKTETPEESHEMDNKQNNYQVTMVFMTMLFFLSTASAGIATLIHVAEFQFLHSELVSYICWWVFLASTAWNPWLYNLSSQQFRETGIQKLQRIKAAVCEGRKWVPSESDNDQSAANSES